jgi:hypothetical protein
MECVICTDDHFTNQCPLLCGPKSSVAYCAASDDNKGFFFHIQVANEIDIVSTDFSLVAAIIKVESGEVSKDLLLATLARIIPVPWQWEVQEEGHKCFIVPFPSKDELTRMVAIGTITTRSKEDTFSIEEYVDDLQPIKVLDQVWVTVTKVLRALRSFLPLWAVGTMIGATQKVDVYHLRRGGAYSGCGFGCQKISKFADVCVKGCMYCLFFKPDEVVVVDQDEDEDLLTDDDKGNDANGDKHMGDAIPPPKPQGDKGTKSASSQPSLSQSGQSHRQATLLQEALDLACEQLFDEISIKVMAEKDSMGWKRYSLLTDEEWRMYNAMVSPPVNPHPFFSNEFDQAAITHLSSVGGTPIFCCPESTPHPAEGEVGGAPTHVPSGGRSLRWGMPCCIRQYPWRTLLSLSSPSVGESLPVAGGMLPSPLPLR